MPQESYDGGNKEALYEATVTTGLEWIAKDEVKQKWNIEASTYQGRIWFRTSHRVQEILKLRTINNLFVVIYDTTLSQDEIPTDTNNLESLLMKVGDEADWNTGIRKWEEISEFQCDWQKLFIKSDETRESQPKFRVSCDRYGPKHEFTSPDVCSLLGHVVDTKFGWPIKMKNFDLELMTNFRENHLYVGITLTPKALDRRNIVTTGLTTLRATTCYALLRIANIQCGDILVDPMAGSGAIPVESCCVWNKEWIAFTLAGEMEKIALHKCKVNLDIFKETGTPNGTLQLDVTRLPFRDGSIDVFVSDLPFGRRHGSKRQNKTLYPALLREMGRVARPGTARAVLLTQDFKSVNISYDKNRELWSQKLCSFVKIGNLNCHMYLFLRRDLVYGASQESQDGKYQDSPTQLQPIKGEQFQQS